MNKEYNIELIVPNLYEEYNIDISKNLTIAESIIIINIVWNNFYSISIKNTV